MKIVYVLLFLILSCNNLPSPKKFQTIEMKGREGSCFIYSIKVPVDWTPKAADALTDLSDTTKPIFEFFIANSQILMTIHNFPVKSADDKIPPQAQVTRWKNQIPKQELALSTTVPQSFGGFSGLLFEAPQVLAWSMQLSSEHYCSLSGKHSEFADDEKEQMQSDYTIKVTGPNKLLEEKKIEIIQAARSFRLIKTIPKQL